MSDASNKSIRFSWLAPFLKFAVFIAIIVALNLDGNWLIHQINFQLFPRHDSTINFMLLGAVLLYVLLMAIPFMPEIAIGLTPTVLGSNKGARLFPLYFVSLLDDNLDV